MSQRKPYSPLRVIQPEFGNDPLNWMTSLESLTQELKASLRRKVEPDYKTAISNDRRFVEDSEELICMRDDDLSTADNQADKTVYDLNVLGAFAIQKYWEDVRAGILTLAAGDEIVPVSEVLRIIDEPVTEIVRMFNNALKAAHGT
jgi:hypothetical protein